MKPNRKFFEKYITLSPKKELAKIHKKLLPEDPLPRKTKDVFFHLLDDTDFRKYVVNFLKENPLP